MIGLHGDPSSPPERGVTRRFRREAHRWDRIYSDGGSLVERWWDRATRGNVRARFQRTFEAAGDLAGRSVLDLGCGSGRYVVEALERGASRVVGVDAAPEMIELARGLAARHPHGDRARLDAADFLGWRCDERFDLVIANGVFDYLPDAAALLARAASWSKGLVVASFPDRRAPRALPRWLYWRARGVPIRLFDRRAIGPLLASAGLEPLGSPVERIGPILLAIARPRGR